MATVGELYDKVLSEVFSWMFGGFENGIQRNIEFIEKHQLKPKCNFRGKKTFWKHPKDFKKF